MNNPGLREVWLKEFPYEPTPDQQELIRICSSFLSGNDRQGIMVLKGYAGTGKTSIISSLVKILPGFDTGSVLLAPTGKAAKVFSQYSGRKATTVHRKIYSLRTSREGAINLYLAPNLHKDTLFIVDEASMIPDQAKPSEGSLFGSQRLLDDLVHYVYQGKNCKLMLIGDTAQLPPVGLEISPALDKEFLKSNYQLSVSEFEMKDVVRQKKESGILQNATNIRQGILKSELRLPVFNAINDSDTFRITGVDLEEKLHEVYAEFGTDGTIIVCRSNKRANIFNQEIRSRILFREHEVSTGDLMMVVRNNYYWLGREDKKGFIANGEVVEIMRISRSEEIYGFRFTDVTVRFVDYPDEPEIDVKIMLDAIMLESPALTWRDHKKLADEIMKDYADEPSHKKRIETLHQSPYYQALQVKFAYALTCHKAQGGQWKAVFVDQGYITTDMVDKEYFRWLYTAVTRATSRLYLVNFNEDFYS